WQLSIPMLGSGSKVQTTTEIRRMDNATSNFRGKHTVLPPSRIVLSADMSKIDPTSMAYLNAIWPRLGWADPAVTLDWAGTGLSKGALFQAPPYVLEGDQCLVFFLGGIPDQHVPGCHGFS